MVLANTNNIELIIALKLKPAHLQPEEDEDVDMLEELQEVPAWDRPPGVGMLGQLKNLTLVDFMCHEHLFVEFG